MPLGLTMLRGTVLDIGAADGWVGKILDPSVHYVSIDTPETGEALYGARPDVFANGKQLPFSDACADAVVCLEVIEHVDDPVRLVSEISRVLRPGGRLFLSVPFLYPIHDAPYDFQRYTRHGIKNLVNQSGLNVIAITDKTSSIHVAGALLCLAIAGGVSAQARWLGALLLLPAVLLVLVINILVFLLGLFWPNWDAMTFGYALTAEKP